MLSLIDLKTIDLQRAANLNFSDYEDALQCVTADRVHAQCIITRNTKDFTQSKIPAITPADQLKIFL